MELRSLRRTTPFTLDISYWEASVSWANRMMADSCWMKRYQLVRLFVLLPVDILTTVFDSTDRQSLCRWWWRCLGGWWVRGSHESRIPPEVFVGQPKSLELLEHIKNPSRKAASSALRISINTGESSFFGTKYLVEKVRVWSITIYTVLKPAFTGAGGRWKFCIRHNCSCSWF